MGAVYLPLLLSASALLISIFSFFYFRSYLKARTSQERILAEMREEVNNILRSINETTDRDISLIEERGKNLRSLLKETDKRVKVYIRELEGHKEAERIFAALPPETPDKKLPPTYEELGKNRYRGNAKENSPLAESEQQATPAASTGEKIRSLVRSGLSPALIASRLGISIAEVEFAAALLERRENL